MAAFWQWEKQCYYKKPEGCSRHVVLQKDYKPICRVKVSDLPKEFPSVWPISRFKHIQMYQQCVLPKSSLLPDPENDYQNTEWVRFMRFLWENKRAAIVRFESCNFHIFASNECPKFSHAVLLRETGQAHLSQKEQMAGTSDGHGNIAATHVSKRSCRNEEFPNCSRKLDAVDDGSPHQDPTRCMGEVICDNGSNFKGINTLHNSHDTPIAELHRTVPEPSPTESIEDDPGTSHPISREKGNGIRRNFVSTDPSYLRTLGQAHASWIFGAIAELVDNSRDAGASRLDISIECLFSKKAGRKIPVLSVIDDGHGMSHVAMLRMISFGHKQPAENDQDRIGRFGIGFKTGAMRLGRDVVILTQTSSSRSVALLSESFNEKKDNLEVPVVTYRKEGRYMEVDLSVQSEATAEYNLKAIKEFSPFNEYFIGEKLGLFGEMGTGAQIYIWNLDKWGSDYSLEWDSGKTSENNGHHGHGDILIRSRRVRSRNGQISQKVPLDYSLQSYLEVIFQNPRMQIFVQGSLVRARPLAKTLNKTSVVTGHIMGKPIQLVLGRSKVEWDRMNCGIFLYWHGRLIEAYKRVGGQKHNADMGRGVIGVADISNLIDDGGGNSWVLNNKQGFQDCEVYAKLEEWLGSKADEYWDKNFDNLDLKKGSERHKPDHKWVQCNSCRKWRILSTNFDIESLPTEWFCYMPPFNGKCETPEQQMGRGVIIVGEKRSGCDEGERIAHQDEAAKNVKATFMNTDRPQRYSDYSKANSTNHSDGDFEGDWESSQTDDETPRPILKRLRRGPPRNCKQS